MKRVLLLPIALFGCPSPNNASEETTGTGTSTNMTVSTTIDSETTSGCTDGTEGCTCIEGGLCVGSLACIEQICRDPTGTSGEDESGGGTEPPPPTTDTGDSGGEPGSCIGHCGEAQPHFGGICLCDPSCMHAGGCCDDYADACPGDCLYNEDCADDEVCNIEQECVYAWGQTYQVCVDYWAKYSNGIVDVYFQHLYGGNLIQRSPTHDSTFVTSWAECSEIEINSDITDGTQSNSVWSILFYDENFFGDTHLNNACEPNGMGGCTFLPLQYLKWGTVYWAQDDDYPYDVTVRFIAL